MISISATPILTHDYLERILSNFSVQLRKDNQTDTQGSQAMEKKTLYMIGNAHIDPVWLWQWQEGFQEVKATFRSALERMQEYPEFIFTASSAAFYEWIEQSDAGMFAEIQQRVAEGRWGLVGGWWIEPDCNIPSGESFVRQALYGQRYFKEKFGSPAQVGYNVDSFGHHAMLPQILKKSALPYYVFMRPMPHEKELPGRAFWWEADDGSRVLALQLPFSYATWLDGLEDHLMKCAGEIQAPLEEMACFYGVGDHGGGPTKANLKSIRKFEQAHIDIHLEHARLEQFFSAVLTRQPDLPVVHDGLQHHSSGCYSAHSGIKRWNRLTENRLLAAEKLSTVAENVTGQPYPTSLGRAWKSVLFSQFHDSLAGTSLEAAYEDARNLYGEALAIADRTLNLAVQSIAWNIHIPPEEESRSVVIFNPHSWAACVPVELEFGYILEESQLVDETGRAVPFQAVRSTTTTGWRKRLCFTADAPALGYKVYRLIPSESSQVFPNVIAQDTCLENETYRLKINPQTGGISSLVDKRTGSQVFSGEAAVGRVIDDPSDTWSHDVLQFNTVIGTFSPLECKVVEAGPVKACLRTVSAYGSSRLTQEFTLYTGLDRIDVKVEVDWREKQKMLKLRFPVNVDSPKVVNEIPFGHIQRKAKGDEEPMQSWVDVTGISPQDGQPYGLSLLNDGKYSFDAQGADIGLTVLRSPIYAHHHPAEPQPDEVYTYMDQGVQRFTYTLLPHAGSWQQAGTVQRAAELNQPSIALAATFHPQGSLPQSDSFLQVGAENVIVSALKKAEDGNGWIVRLYETAGRETRAILQLPLFKRKVEAAFKPCEIKTFFIPGDLQQPVKEVNLLEWEED
jgi:alpha-mannosidase